MRIKSFLSGIWSLLWYIFLRVPGNPHLADTPWYAPSHLRHHQDSDVLVPIGHQGLLLLTWNNLIPELIANRMHSYVWAEITVTLKFHFTSCKVWILVNLWEKSASRQPVVYTFFPLFAVQLYNPTLILFAGFNHQPCGPLPCRYTFSVSSSAHAPVMSYMAVIYQTDHPRFNWFGSKVVLLRLREMFVDKVGGGLIPFAPMVRVPV